MQMIMVRTEGNYQEWRRMVTMEEVKVIMTVKMVTMKVITMTKKVIMMIVSMLELMIL